jgi:hypothetical protein
MIEQVEFRGYRNLWLAIEGGSATPAPQADGALWGNAAFPKALDGVTVSAHSPGTSGVTGEWHFSLWRTCT